METSCFQVWPDTLDKQAPWEQVGIKTKVLTAYQIMQAFCLQGRVYFFSFLTQCACGIVVMKLGLIPDKKI